MYGKIFSSLFTGSMYGAGAPAFTLMSYVIANMRPDKEVGFQVELNIKDLSNRIGEPEGVIQKAIDYLCAPDPHTRTSGDDGRRLVKVGTFDYRVVNGVHYAEIRNEEERRERNRLRQKKHRLKHKPGQDGKPASEGYKALERIAVDALENGNGEKFEALAAGERL
jgi:hypothetical protein